MIDKEKILKLFQGYFISFDAKSYMINYVQKGDKLLAENIDFSESMRIMNEEQKIISHEDFKVDDLDFFITNPYIQGKFLFPFRKEDGTNHYYRIIKEILKDETLIYLEEFDDHNALSTLTDPLTDVYQKDVIEQFVNNKIGINKNRKFYMMIVDIDEFKSFNDNYGHLIGDEVLRKTAQVFKKLYKNGLIGRIGGDEFVIVDFSTSDKDTIIKKCEELLNEVQNISIDGIENKITITMGLSFYPEDKDYRSLLLTADKRLYKGKKSGKNKYIID